MATCSICYEPFTAPVSLPCGHVFCRECIRRTIDLIKSCSVQHRCPTCRVPYSVVTLDTALIPPYLRPHLQPPIRPLFLDDHSHPPTTTSPSESTPSPTDTSALISPSPSSAACSSQSALGHAQAEITVLRLSCATWRRRAEVHAAANAGLLGFARATKDAAVRMRGERDEARKRCALMMKRKLLHSEEAEAEAVARIPGPPSPRTSSSDSEHEYEPVHAWLPRIPAYLQSHHTSPSSLSDNEKESSCFGPPFKRRKHSTTPAPTTRSFTEPPFPGIHIAGDVSDTDVAVLDGISTGLGLSMSMLVSDVRNSGAGVGVKVGQLIL